VSGREICRRQFLDSQFFVFGSPSGILYRGDVVRNKKPFFKETAIHGDTDVCYTILRSWDFGFVHQILSFKRVGNAGICAGRAHLNPHPLDKFIALVTHGRNFLSQEEFDRLFREFRREYFRVLARGLFYPHGWAQYHYHQAGLRSVGHELSLATLSPHILYVLGSFIVNPAQTAEGVWRGIKRFFRLHTPLGVRRVGRHQA